MGEKLDYESSVDRREEILARREIIWWRAFYVLVALFTAIILLGCLAWYAMQPLEHHVTVEVFNCTPVPIEGAGMDAVCNQREIDVGPIPAWESRKTSVDYLADLCIAGFSFDQAGQTLRVPLSGNTIDDDSTYRIKIGPGSLAVVCRKIDGSIQAFNQVPTTQPINYSMK